jgi:hypothetical protein
MDLDKKILTEYEKELKLAGEGFMERFNERDYKHAMAYFYKLNQEAQEYIKKHPDYHWALLLATSEMDLR